MPIEVVRGVDEVTAWLWPNKPDPVTVRFPVRQWAKVERKAEQVAGGDVGRVLGEIIADDALGGYLEE